jgi:hypothetical protein
MSDRAGGVPMHRLERSIRALSTRPVRDLERKHARAVEDGLAEYEQQFQIPIRGILPEDFEVPEAGEGATFLWSWVEQRIDFAAPFYDASEQRDSAYVAPHFTYGAVIESGSPAMVAACVRQWRRNKQMAIVGATLAIGASITDGPFGGYLHATFQGYSQPDFEDLGV